ncbi:type I-D CRISPR-associated protein Cas5/Csc1 [Neomoorella thermoacetica]|uniref:type I-D CRISPR-associated protein Cas5/Csc1 n=1 Tax=Neomoorella thermoacetica TaxID=1525 RepID=UPI0009BE2591|nr:type I-D CRISPR-associated protein Cas5/Csc1 [Moorella thermoacetica]
MIGLLVYELEITLQERVFFASREIDKFFLTEPVIGNYALAYAFNLVTAPYRVGDVKNEEPVYKVDLTSLNRRGIYLTPATPLQKPVLVVERFNALTDSYWYQMSPNVVVGDLAYKLDKELKRRPANFPQEGYLRLLARGNRLGMFLCSREEVDIPPYIRLGKFNSKARVKIVQQWENPPRMYREDVPIDYYLNPLDIPASSRVKLFDLLSVPPVPLIKNIVLSGEFYQLAKGKCLPAGMAFGGLEECAP